MTKRAFWGLFACAVLGALLLRTLRLDVRPMHSDEANQAVKFGDLLERGEYRYDPKDHHGPTLYYLTLPLARALAGKSLAAVSETTLRLVPAIFGTGVLLLLLLFLGGLAREAVFSAALLAALSPALTYYSRFYIQETLLVFILAGLLAAGWRYFRTRSGWWAAAAGFAAGMMYATKETSVILFGALAGAAVIDRLFRPKTSGARPPDLPAAFLHLVIFAAAAFGSAGLFFTSFLKNPKGLTDSARAFVTYFSRAGEPGVHAEPWFYYIQTLVYSRFGHGPVWSEVLIVALAVVGSIFAFGPKAGKDGHPRLVRFIFFFTVMAAAVYSAISYKTPWNLLPFYLGVVLLAGNGAGVLWRSARSTAVKAAILSIMALGILNLAYQDHRANFVDYANPTNPYVYAQTSPDFLKLVRAVEGIAAGHPDHEKMLIKVVAPPDETWPLPWYLRRFERVGYWAAIAQAGDLRVAPVVIASAAFADAVGQSLGGGYRSAFYGLRPEVVLSLFVRQDLWDDYLKGRENVDRRSSRSSSKPS